MASISSATSSAIPSDFWQRMAQQLDVDAQHAFQEALQKTPPTSIRLHPEKVHHSPFASSEKIAWHPQGYFLPERPSFVADPIFHAGGYYVQEASSMLLYQEVDWSRDYRILDFCAAPGGKSSLIAGAMSADSYLVANDVVPSRASILQENMTRWGNTRVSITSSSAAAFARSGATFDLIVVDAPCSGEGMFRKDAFAIEQWSPELVRQCAERQRDILQHLLPCLAAGGTLIYSTCTYAPAEDEDMIAWLLQNSALESSPLPDLSIYGAEAVPILGGDHVAYRCYPHMFQGEGFFIARLEDTRVPSPDKKAKKPTPAAFPKQVKQFLADYLPDAVLKRHTVQETKKGWNLVAKHAPTLEGVKTLQTGLPVAKPFGKGARAGLNPLHGLAMIPQVQGERLELSREDALRYLCKLELESPTTYKGWLLASYQHVPLGWLKAGGGRVNNYYPLEWRIRKSLAEVL